ncbi:MAG: imidazole glycerol phosphate synthase subunit HisH [Gemmatimonadota bacterium]|uniref:imidazole glycerol phosphate synthase subunit HisH n=1 Tax=Candidatus Palauibacter scopulicola TaxID=3056741 RepID=UPI00239CB4D8|nr:imidazole glycerol phosphate synthase subunit HisH [Candidatus Palauibacter scopulicola]MDE2662665.1 imidazole glycerol phosphate synthase subunit HisH [Candidatus Palauibacter scopulicola]
MSAARMATGPRDVGIVPTGVANLEAVAAAFRRLGRTPRLLDSATGISSADYVVLPGVGSFAGGMAELRRRGWAEAVRGRVEAGRPTLAICLGLQLLCEGSEEAPGTAGLGCVPGRVVRLAESCRIPQLGWNLFAAPAGTVFLRSSVVYFANSYGLEAGPAGWTAAMGRHGSRFVAGLERGGVLACQFHPELSGKVGAGLLKRWLDESPGAAAAFERRAQRPTLAAAC